MSRLWLPMLALIGLLALGSSGVGCAPAYTRAHAVGTVGHGHGHAHAHPHPQGEHHHHPHAHPHPAGAAHHHNR